LLGLVLGESTETRKNLLAILLSENRVDLVDDADAELSVA
jgi:hypothetical protein